MLIGNPDGRVKSHPCAYAERYEACGPTAYEKSPADLFFFFEVFQTVLLWRPTRLGYNFR